MPFLIGKKVKMTQLWKGNRVVPVTVVRATPNAVSLVRLRDRDGYDAVQVRAGATAREFRSGRHGAVDVSQFKPGATVNVSVFKEGDFLKVRGVSKGRGFQGVVKRHGFGGGPKTHGQKNRFRAPGSIGSTAPQRVVPGRRMAGHMGAVRVTVKNLEVAGVDPERNLLFIKGAVPGSPGGLLEVSGQVG